MAKCGLVISSALESTAYMCVFIVLLVGFGLFVLVAFWLLFDVLFLSFRFHFIVLICVVGVSTPLCLAHCFRVFVCLVLGFFLDLRATKAINHRAILS